MQGGSLSIHEGQNIVQNADVEEQIRQEVKNGGVQSEGIEVKQRRCGLCNNIGHNARTCARR